MSLNYIKIKNFRNFEGEHEIKFMPELNVIMGSNETGKTNVVNAIFWCLYGEELVEEFNNLPMANIDANDDVEVECGFIVDGKEVIVVRNYSDNKFNFSIQCDEIISNVEDLIPKDHLRDSYDTGERLFDLNKLSWESEAELNQLLDKFSFKNNLEIKEGSLYSNGNAINPEDLSAGESLLMSLLAKIVTTDDNLPLMYDTPLARLDSSSRKPIIDVLAHCNRQIILLSLPDECLEQFIVYDLNVRCDL